MNPGKLNKRLTFHRKVIIEKQELTEELFTVWGQRIIKTKRREDEQNEESYELLVRLRNDLEPYLVFQLDGIWYDLLITEPHEKFKGYMLLKCEKAKVHNFYDTVTVARSEWIEVEHEDKENMNTIYDSIPCELIKITERRSNDSQQHQDIDITYVLQLETKYNLMTGDKLEIVHKQDRYHAIVEDYFRYHTYQEVTIRMEGKA